MKLPNKPVNSAKNSKDRNGKSTDGATRLIQDSALLSKVGPGKLPKKEKLYRGSSPNKKKSMHWPKPNAKQSKQTPIGNTSVR